MLGTLLISGVWSQIFHCSFTYVLSFGRYWNFYVINALTANFKFKIDFALIPHSLQHKPKEKISLFGKLQTWELWHTIEKDYLNKIKMFNIGMMET